MAHVLDFLNEESWLRKIPESELKQNWEEITRMKWSDYWCLIDIFEINAPPLDLLRSIDKDVDKKKMMKNTEQLDEKTQPKRKQQEI